MEPQWVPSERDIAEARVTDFARFVTARTGAETADYHALWRWSVDNLSEFWLALWEYFDLGPIHDEVLPCPEMPNARWFPGTTLNYVDRVAGQARTDRPAVLQVTEGSDEVTETSWADLLAGAAAFARTLRDLEVKPGDRVIGYLPNITETVVAFLGTAAIGAIWSACGQDYSAKAALDRLGQLEPVVLVTADGYRYGGKTHDKSADIAALRAGSASLRATVVVYRLGVEMPGSISLGGGGDRRGPGTRDRHRWISTTRCGSCSPPAPPACPRASCTATAACCWSTSKPSHCNPISAPTIPSSGTPARAG